MPVLEHNLTLIEESAIDIMPDVPHEETEGGAE
jgi:hypothetical protein